MGTHFLSLILIICPDLADLKLHKKMTLRYVSFVLLVAMVAAKPSNKGNEFDCLKQRRVCSNYQIHVVPTMMLFKDTKFVTKIEGYHSFEQLSRFLQGFMTTAQLEKTCIF